MRNWHVKSIFNLYTLVAALFLFLLVLASIPALANTARRIAADFFHPFFSASNVLDRNESIRAAFELTASSQLDALSRENDELRRIAGLEQLPKFRYVVGEVRQFDPLYWNERFLLNRGSADGVEPGCAVIALTTVNNNLQAVVAGFTRSVATDSCEVLTLTNPELRVPVKLLRAQEVGFINGDNLPQSRPDMARLSNLPLSGRYRIGDVAVTTDFSTGVPAGLRLGTLAILDEEDPMFSGALTRHGYLAPALQGPDAANFMMVVVPERGE